MVEEEKRYSHAANIALLPLIKLTTFEIEYRSQIFNFQLMGCASFRGRK